MFNRLKIIGVVLILVLEMIPAATVVAQDPEGTDLEGNPPPPSVEGTQRGQPVPDSVIVVHNGLEWVWASPCALNGCTTGIDVGHDNFVFATEEQWALRPPASAFRNPDKCAAPWFDHKWDHCDWRDTVWGRYGSAPAGGTPGGPDGSSPMHPYGETWLVRVNRPPTADAGGPYLVEVGSTIHLDGSGSDPDNDPLTCAWSVSEGSFDDANAEDPNYTAGTNAGIFDLTLTINDGRGGTARATTTILVCDPAGGFVTGGGWIDSPAGAYKPDTSLSGKATFGFASQYKKGAARPAGNTEFQFKAGDLNFQSDTQEWLVVNQNDSSAQFKGSGTINGQSYKFVLWAGDGDPDTFRLRIWAEDSTGKETDVYDNGPGQALGGGSITIHKAKS